MQNTIVSLYSRPISSGWGNECLGLDPLGSIFHDPWIHLFYMVSSYHCEDVLWDPG